ncbi:serine hydrolase domain-containing protein [Microbulbifer epialgicus]|uniref:Serine hydrolase domain-containing protein n=1 Tax=Microbulbifer epialgicus TaxID=393907 RepID=A0ABV4NVU3_9GAMM
MLSVSKISCLCGGRWIGDVFMCHRFILGVIAVFLIGCINQPSKLLEDDQAWKNRLGSSFTRQVDRKVELGMAALEVVPGLAVAIYTPDGIYTQGYGVSNIETAEPVSTDTAFYIASSTKPLTALAMSFLNQRGEINLDATLSDFAPGADFPKAVNPNQVTLRHLLSQSSGLVNHPIQIRSAFTGKSSPEILWELLSQTKQK